MAELYDEYVKRVMHFDAQPLPEVDSDDEEDDEEQADAHMARRLEAGLYTLQMICVVVGTVSIHSPKARDRVRDKLHQKDHTPGDIREVVINFAQTPAREFEVASAAGVSATRVFRSGMRWRSAGFDFHSRSPSRACSSVKAKLPARKASAQR